MGGKECMTLCPRQKMVEKLGLFFGVLSAIWGTARAQSEGLPWGVDSGCLPAVYLLFSPTRIGFM